MKQSHVLKQMLKLSVEMLLVLLLLLVVRAVVLICLCMYRIEADLYLSV